MHKVSNLLLMRQICLPMNKILPPIRINLNNLEKNQRRIISNEIREQGCTAMLSNRRCSPSRAMRKVWTKRGRFMATTRSSCQIWKGHSISAIMNSEALEPIRFKRWRQPLKIVKWRGVSNKASFSQNRRILEHKSKATPLNHTRMKYQHPHLVKYKQHR